MRWTGDETWSARTHLATCVSRSLVENLWGRRFVHLDAGAYHGLMEFSGLSSHPFRVVLGVLGGSGEIPSTVVGPTCDSLDVLFGGELSLPENLRIGDVVVVPLSGAYSSTCSSPFNGFSIPTTVVLVYLVGAV